MPMDTFFNFINHVRLIYPKLEDSRRLMTEYTITSHVTNTMFSEFFIIVLYKRPDVLTDRQSHVFKQII